MQDILRKIILFILSLFLPNFLKDPILSQKLFSIDTTCFIVGRNYTTPITFEFQRPNVSIMKFDINKIFLIQNIANNPLNNPDDAQNVFFVYKKKLNNSGFFTGIFWENSKKEISIKEVKLNLQELLFENKCPIGWKNQFYSVVKNFGNSTIESVTPIMDKIFSEAKLVFVDKENIGLIEEYYYIKGKLHMITQKKPDKFDKTDERNLVVLSYKILEEKDLIVIPEGVDYQEFNVDDPSI